MPVMKTSRLGADAGASLGDGEEALPRMTQVLAPPKPREVLSVARRGAGQAGPVAKSMPGSNLAEISSSDAAGCRFYDFPRWNRPL